MFSQMAVYKINSEKSIAFLYKNDKWDIKEIREITPFTIAKNNKIPWCNTNKARKRSV